MSQGPLCPNLTQKVQKEVSQMANHNDKQWPLLISLKDESKKQEIFQNLNKIRESETPFNKINIAHDLTKKQKEELQEKIKEAHEREQNDQSGEWMYRV